MVGGRCKKYSVPLLPRLRMFWSILGGSYIYNTGLPSLGLPKTVPSPRPGGKRLLWRPEHLHRVALEPQTLHSPEQHPLIPRCS